MGNKRFRTQRLWHNTLLMVWAVPFVLLPGIIVGASTGKFLLFQCMIGLAITGLVVAMIRDRRKNCLYTMEGDRLSLIRNNKRRVVPMTEIVDASLIDRAAARAYLHEQGMADGSDPRVVDGFTNYCTVDIGLTTFTVGLGRNMIDRLPNAKSDLVLLRLQGGEDLLLSPVHAQDLVDGLSRRKIGLEYA